MTDVTLIHVGDFKEKYFSQAFDEYKKRLSAYCRFTDVCIKEERLQNENSPAEIQRALEKEAAAIKKAVPPRSFVISLCVEGKKMTSEGFAAALENAVMQSPVCFIIGSSHGLAPEIKNESQLRLSFSDMTFPHQLMRVILAEQIYRAFTITAGKAYHK